ncbi:extracellular solute-binding protein [Bacillus sp. FSL K6-3431]|uniref:extracellular solute-binding protein n=1 Tax=Bacillus sp. FSL K6-3431 TaxID=2921500 RepID=UPI0030F609FF
MKSQIQLYKLPIYLFIGLLALMLVLSACSNKSSKEGEDKEKKYKISILTEYHTAEPPTKDNPITKEFEKRTNTELDILWTSPNTFDEKISVTLASGNIPDLMKLPDVTHPNFQELVKKGVFWDLTPYIQDYPNLMEYPEQTWKATSVDGKNYVIPSVRPLEGASSLPAVRKDWLDNLEMDVPESMDDLFEVLKSFTNDDPDGNGKDDTIGYSARGFAWVYDTFTNSNGKWKLADGELIDATLEPGTKNALIWLQKVYDEGLMPKDFAVMQQSQSEDLAKGGIAGVSSDTVEGIYRSTMEAEKIDPKADFLPLSWLMNDEGEKYVGQSKGYSFVYAIPKTVPEDKMKRILELMDYGASEEGFELACYGLEEIHFTVDENGFKTATEQALKDSVAQASFGKIFERSDPYLWAYRTGMPKEIFERNKGIIDERSKVSLSNLSIGIISETYNKYGTEFEKKIEDLKVKVIMGKEPIEAWDRFVNELKSDDNYQKIIEEMNIGYREKYGN